MIGCWFSVQKGDNCHISYGLSKANANRASFDLDQSGFSCTSFNIPAMIKQQATKIAREQFERNRVFEKRSSYCYRELISFAHLDFEGQGDSRLTESSARVKEIVAEDMPEQKIAQQTALTQKCYEQPGIKSNTVKKAA